MIYGTRKEYMPRSPMREGKPRRERPIKRAGKRTKKWAAERARQKRLSMVSGRTACQLRMPGCTFRAELTYAHHRKRRKIVKEGLEIVILCCRTCHDAIEGKPEMESIVLWVREHADEEYFICACRRPVTPGELKVDREVHRGLCCDECYLAKEAA